MHRSEAKEAGPAVVTPALCREARTLLGWSRYRLAPRCGLSHTSIRLFEIGARGLHPDGLAGIQRALEAAGIEFTYDTTPGVRLLRQDPQPKILPPDQITRENRR